MSLAPPDDYDEEQTETTGKETPETSQDPAQGRSQPEVEEPKDGKDTEKALRDLHEAVEVNSSAFHTKADIEEVKRLEQAFQDLQEQLTGLQEDYQKLHSYLQELEQWRGDRIEASNRNTEAINQLDAAVFGDTPECPECEDGHLTNGASWLSKRLVCSNKQCGFEQKVTEI